MQNYVVAYFCTKIFSLSLEILCGFLKKNILKTLPLAVYLYGSSSFYSMTRLPNEDFELFPCHFEFWGIHCYTVGGAIQLYRFKQNRVMLVDPGRAVGLKLWGVDGLDLLRDVLSRSRHL